MQIRYLKSIPGSERTHKIIFEASHKYGFNDIRFESDAEAVCMKSNYLNLTVDTVTVIGELLYLDGNNFCTLKKAAIGFTVQHDGKVMAS